MTFKLQSVRQSPVYINARDRLLRKKELILAEKTPFEVIYRKGLSNVRYYAAKSPKITHKTPIVIVSPLAVNLYIYDLTQERSLIKVLIENGFNVYAIDWGEPSLKQTNASLEHYVLNYLPNLLTAVRAHAHTQDLTLHGWSLGGIFAFLYAAVSKDPHIKNLIILGSPVDTYASTQGKVFKVLAKVFTKIQHRTGLHPRQLPPWILHSHGPMNALSFKLMDPLGTLKGHYNLVKNLGDRNAVASHATLGAFLNDMLDYPGGILRDMIMKINLENPFMRGGMVLGNNVVDLKDITSSILVVAGSSDTLCTPESAKPLIDVTSSTDTEFKLVSSGHVGIVSSTEAATDLWPMMLAWLNKRSN